LSDYIPGVDNTWADDVSRRQATTADARQLLPEFALL